MKQRMLFLCLIVVTSLTFAEPPSSANGTHVGGAWQEGEHYERLNSGISQASSRGKVKVVEFFWFGCPHCFTLEPALAHWLQRKPERVEFERVPEAYRPERRAHAQLFYTLEALGRGNLDAKVFETIHGERNRLFVRNDYAKTREVQRKFAVANGIDAIVFERTYDSPKVATDVQRALDLAIQQEVESVPTFVVNGKYKTDVRRAGSVENLFAVIDYLIAAEVSRATHAESNVAARDVPLRADAANVKTPRNLNAAEKGDVMTKH